jgi:hypothetical protein
MKIKYSEVIFHFKEKTKDFHCNPHAVHDSKNSLFLPSKIFPVCFKLILHELQLYKDTLQYVST